MKKLSKVSFFSLYWNFFKVGLLAVGGGYAMMPISEKILIEENNLITLDEFVEDYSLAQALPGVIMANTASLVGQRINGKIGSIAAVLGIITPSIITLSFISSIFVYLGVLSKAFMGIRILIVAMLLRTLVKLAKMSLTTIYKTLFTVGIIILLYLNYISPIAGILLSIFIGVFISFWRKI